MKSYTLIVILLFSTLVSAHAQKLPNKQEVSVWAPANIKIDGKATEWNNQYQAYNKVTGVFYTVSNDDNNLYLTLQVANVLNIRKLLFHGLTFTVYKDNLKDSLKKVEITYPVMNRNSSFPLADKVESSPQVKSTNGAGKKLSDSLVQVLNKDLTLWAKEISVAGISQFNDNSLSVYNDVGIKVTALFDDKKAYTCELALPLKYLGWLTGPPAPFHYNIKLNGIDEKINTVTVLRTFPDGSVEVKRSSALSGQFLVSTLSPERWLRGQFLDAPIDFSGEYTLAKKP